MHLGSAVAGAHKTTPIHQRKRNCTKRNDEDKRERDKMKIYEDTRSLWALRARLLVGGPSGRLLALRSR